MRNPAVAAPLVALALLGTACPPQYPAGRPSQATADPGLCEPCPPCADAPAPSTSTSAGDPATTGPAETSGTGPATDGR